MPPEKPEGKIDISIRPPTRLVLAQGHFIVRSKLKGGCHKKMLDPVGIFGTSQAPSNELTPAKQTLPGVRWFPGPGDSV